MRAYRFLALWIGTACAYGDPAAVLSDDGGSCSGRKPLSADQLSDLAKEQREWCYCRSFANYSSHWNAIMRSAAYDEHIRSLSSPVLYHLVTMHIRETKLSKLDLKDYVCIHCYAFLRESLPFLNILKRSSDDALAVYVPRRSLRRGKPIQHRIYDKLKSIERKNAAGGAKPEYLFYYHRPGRDVRYHYAEATKAPSGSDGSKALIEKLTLPSAERSMLSGVGAAVVPLLFKIDRARLQELEVFAASLSSLSASSHEKQECISTLLGKLAALEGLKAHQENLEDLIGDEQVILSIDGPTGEKLESTTSCDSAVGAELPSARAFDLSAHANQNVEFCLHDSLNLIPEQNLLGAGDAALPQPEAAIDECDSPISEGEGTGEGENLREILKDRDFKPSVEECDTSMKDERSEDTCNTLEWDYNAEEHATRMVDEQTENISDFLELEISTEKFDTSTEAEQAEVMSGTLELDSCANDCGTSTEDKQPEETSNTNAPSAEDSANNCEKILSYNTLCFMESDDSCAELMNLKFEAAESVPSNAAEPVPSDAAEAMPTEAAEPVPSDAAEPVPAEPHSDVTDAATIKTAEASNSEDSRRKTACLDNEIYISELLSKVKDLHGIDCSPTPNSPVEDSVARRFELCAFDSFDEDDTVIAESSVEFSAELAEPIEEIDAKPDDASEEIDAKPDDASEEIDAKPDDVSEEIDAELADPFEEIDAKPVDASDVSNPLPFDSPMEIDPEPLDCSNKGSKAQDSDDFSTVESLDTVIYTGTRPVSALYELSYQCNKPSRKRSHAERRTPSPVFYQDLSTWADDPAIASSDCSHAFTPKKRRMAVPDKPAPPHLCTGMQLERALPLQASAVDEKPAAADNARIGLRTGLAEILEGALLAGAVVLAGYLLWFF
ncbi:hypothetical protein PAPHI01_2339 [Pancytospora philotis]|nr:hypothetical protein PAPHI01_2339 [Pancytospora philotis]